MITNQGNGSLYTSTGIYVADPGRRREFEALALLEKNAFLCLFPDLDHTLFAFFSFAGRHASRVARHRARGHG